MFGINRYKTSKKSLKRLSPRTNTKNSINRLSNQYGFNPLRLGS